VSRADLVRATTTCTVESDGYHAHRYRLFLGAWTHVTITHHLHAWNAEHFARWPDSKPADVWRGQNLVGKFDTLAEAWAEFAGEAEIPAVDCKAVQS
jgi:hypothetical protein